MRLGRPRLGRLGGRCLRGRSLGGGQRRLRGPGALEGLSVVDALEAELGLGVAEALGARLRELLAVARERALLEGLSGAVAVLEVLADGRPRLAVLREGRARPRVGVAARRRRRDGLVAFAARRVAVLGGGRLVQRARGLVGLGRVFLGRRELAALRERRLSWPNCWASGERRCERPNWDQGSRRRERPNGDHASNASSKTESKTSSIDE